jgi:hypothetical protein
VAARDVHWRTDTAAAKKAATQFAVGVLTPTVGFTLLRESTEVVTANRYRLERFAQQNQ